MNNCIATSRRRLFGILSLLIFLPNLNGEAAEDFKPAIMVVLEINDNMDMGSEEIEAIAKLLAAGDKILPDVLSVYGAVHLRLRGGLLDLAMNCKGGDKGELLLAVRRDLDKILRNQHQNDADLVNFITAGIEFVSQEGVIDDRRLLEAFELSERSPVRTAAKRSLEALIGRESVLNSVGLKQVPHVPAEVEGGPPKHGVPQPQAVVDTPTPPFTEFRSALVVVVATLLSLALALRVYVLRRNRQA